MTTGRSGRAVALAMLVASLALAGCGASRVTAGGATPQAATATPTGLLPAFADWRIASLAGPGAPLHVLTLDGKSDLTGPTLAAGAHNLTISPNGRTIAYLTAPKYGPITLLELDARTLAARAITVPASVSSLFGEAWSPDGSRLAISGTVNDAPGMYLWTLIPATPRRCRAPDQARRTRSWGSRTPSPGGWMPRISSSLVAASA